MLNIDPSTLPVSMSADKVSELILGVGGLLVCIMIVRVWPRAAAAAWCAMICFVPCWVGVTVKYGFPAAVALTVVLVIALLPTVPREVSVADWIVGAFFTTGTVPLLLGLATETSVIILVTSWGAAFVLGRVLPLHVGLDWLYKCLAVFFTFVAIGALIEFIFSWNPFTQIPGNNALHATWAPLQERGGVLRAEGAFGHSIALGTSVALVIPLVIASRFSFRVRSGMLLLMLACEVVTFSRAGMVCAALGIALMVVFGREGLTARIRAVIATVLLCMAVAATPILTSTFSAAGPEATKSADYRVALASLVSDISFLGRSPDKYETASGVQYSGSFRSVDNAALVLGMTYGLLPLLIVGGLLIGSIYLVATRTATAPTVAMIAQIPAFVSVALITQYQIVVWFIAGLAVCSQTMRRAGPNEDESTDYPRATADRADHVHAIRGHGVATGGVV